MKKVVLTPEMKEKLAGCYIILRAENRIVRLGDEVQLTPENFKAYVADDEDVWQELTVDDFTWYNEDGSDKELQYQLDCYNEYLERENTPQEVKELLHPIIEKRIQAAQEGKENE